VLDSTLQNPATRLGGQGVPVRGITFLTESFERFQGREQIADGPGIFCFAFAGGSLSGGERFARGSGVARAGLGAGVGGVERETGTDQDLAQGLRGDLGVRSRHGSLSESFLQNLQTRDRQRMRHGDPAHGLSLIVWVGNRAEAANREICGLERGGKGLLSKEAKLAGVERAVSRIRRSPVGQRAANPRMPGVGDRCNEQATSLERASNRREQAFGLGDSPEQVGDNGCVMSRPAEIHVGEARSVRGPLERGDCKSAGACAQITCHLVADRAEPQRG